MDWALLVLELGDLRNAFSQFEDLLGCEVPNHTVYHGMTFDEEAFMGVSFFSLGQSREQILHPVKCKLHLRKVPLLHVDLWQVNLPHLFLVWLDVRIALQWDLDTLVSLLVGED